MKNEKGNFLWQYSPFFLMPNFEKLNHEKFSPHLDSDFSFGGILLTSFSLLCIQVLKTCCHFMLNASWDASQ
jgi:hypothetical protein